MNQKYSVWLVSFFSLGMRSISLVAKFLLTICLVRYFSASDVGLYGILTAVVAYSLFFLGFEYYNYTTRKLVGVTSIQQVTIIRDQFLFHFAIFTTIIPFFIVLLYFAVFPSYICIYLIPLVFVEQLSNELMRILIAFSKIHLANVVFFVRQGLWVFFLAPLFYLFPASRQFYVILIAWIIGASISILIGAYSLSHLPWKRLWEKKFSINNLHKGLCVARPFIITAFCALSMLYMERFFVGYFCGLAELGVYTFFAGISVALHNVVNAGVAKLRLYQLMDSWKKEKYNIFKREANYMLKFTFITVIILTILSASLIYPFLKFIDKSIYLTHINIFYVLLLSAACRAFADAPLYIIYAQHKDNLLLFINLSAFVIILFGNIIFVPYYGVFAAAIASLISSIVLLLISLLLMRIRMLRVFATIKPRVGKYENINCNRLF